MPDSVPPSIPEPRSIGPWLARNRKIAILLSLVLVLAAVAVYRFWPSSSPTTNTSTNTTNTTVNNSTTNTSAGSRSFERFQADMATNTPVVNTRRPTAEETAKAIKDLESSTNTNTP